MPLVKEIDWYARVHAGAEHLDHVRPGWFREINPGVLDLRDVNLCVLGQLYREYSLGLGVLGISFDQTQSMGFAVGRTVLDPEEELISGDGRLTRDEVVDLACEKAYTVLTWVWKQEIKDRLALAA